MKPDMSNVTQTGQPQSSLPQSLVLSPFGRMNTPARDIYSLCFPSKKVKESGGSGTLTNHLPF